MSWPRGIFGGETITSQDNSFEGIPPRGTPPIGDSLGGDPSLARSGRDGPLCSGGFDGGDGAETRDRENAANRFKPTPEDPTSESPTSESPASESPARGTQERRDSLTDHSPPEFFDLSSDRVESGSVTRSALDQDGERKSASSREQFEEQVGPRIIPRPEHNVSRRDIDPDALRILYRLHQKGHKGYLVGGGVRDLNIGKRPKDFDIATDAKPRRLQRLFRNCRIIGRRFRLAHLYFPNGKIIEVATFRSSGESDEVVRDGDLIHRDNVFGSPGEDARRRDLTVNGLFYDIATFSIIDYVGGFEDLKEGRIRTIGDPAVSFREDPVRMLRVVRHATRLGFKIDEETRRALVSERTEILKANEARLLEEFYKDLASGSSREYFEELYRSKFLDLLMPAVVTMFRDDAGGPAMELFFESLARLDQLQAQGLEITHCLGLSALLAPLILPVTESLRAQGDEAQPEPFQKVLQPVFRRLKIYRRDEERLWHILGAWHRISRAYQRGSIPKSLSKRHYFPEATEVFALLSPESPELVEFMEEVRRLPPPTEEEPSPSRRPRRRSKRGRNRSRGGRGRKRSKSDSPTKMKTDAAREKAQGGPESSRKKKSGSKRSDPSSPRSPKSGSGSDRSPSRGQSAKKGKSPRRKGQGGDSSRGSRPSSTSRRNRASDN